MINFAIKYSNKTMKIERKYLKLAQTNSIIMSILNITILSILKNNIVGLTAWIILGYGLVVYLSWLPAYYISYKYHWNEGPLLSHRRLYLPLLVTGILLITSFLYSSVAFGYSWMDYFYYKGAFNAEKVLAHLFYTIVLIVLICIIQFVGMNSEHEVVLNADIVNRYVQHEEAAVLAKEKTMAEEGKEQPIIPLTVTLHGSTKDSILTIEPNQFVYAESNANYVNVVYYDGEVKQKSIRMTIKQLEETMADYPQVMRCHRAYMVNIDKEYCLEGTASKGEAHLTITSKVIPVSKTYLETFSQRLKQGENSSRLS